MTENEISQVIFIFFRDYCHAPFGHRRLALRWAYGTTSLR